MYVLDSNALIHAVHMVLTCCSLMLPGRTKLVIEESEGIVGMTFRSKNQMNVIFFRPWVHTAKYYAHVLKMHNIIMGVLAIA